MFTTLSCPDLVQSNGYNAISILRGLDCKSDKLTNKHSNISGRLETFNELAFTLRIIGVDKEATMTVWVYPDRKFEEFGAVRYRVSWEELKPSARKKLGKNQDINPDLDVNYHIANYRSREDAVKFAQTIVDEGIPFYGAAYVTKQIVDWFVEEDRVAEWVNCGESEEFTASLVSKERS